MRWRSRSGVAIPVWASAAASTGSDFEPACGVRLAVGGHQRGRDPYHLVAGQEQAVCQAAGESTAVLDGPGEGALIGEGADPPEQHTRSRSRHSSRSTPWSTPCLHRLQLLRHERACAGRFLLSPSRSPLVCCRRCRGRGEGHGQGTDLLLRVDGSAAFYQVTPGQGPRPVDRRGHVNGRAFGHVFSEVTRRPRRTPPGKAAPPAQPAPIGALVAAARPAAGRGTEVDAKVGCYGDLLVSGRFRSLVPGQRPRRCAGRSSSW
jgi:hypothetical protein